MDALPYVDSLIREYLLFRGFVSSLEAFSRDLEADPGCGLQVGQEGSTVEVDRKGAAETICRQHQAAGGEVIMEHTPFVPCSTPCTAN
jgi:hypothetical protein